MGIQNYQFIRLLGKGGMGEVQLVYDTVCKRNVALKRIREDLQKFKSIRERFLREAHIAAALSHPSIIPIFSIDETENYYTMPYVEGETLKQILRHSESNDPKVAIPALIRIFLPICQAVAYCHSKEILHRDLKPENILVGKFGEVLILDWGLAEFKNGPSIEEEEIDIGPTLTRPGKVVGTLAYLAPERLKEPASDQTDLYALGVILYQILTLKLPFKRKDLETFRKACSYETLLDPIEAAPYRDIPHALSRIVKKCLQPEKEKRYQKVAELIVDLENFIEGRPEWILTAELQIDRKEDWEFQENVLLAKHIAITRKTEIMEWVNLMISNASFSGNTKIETFIKLGKTSSGIGFLLNVPEAGERHDLMDGYSVWIGSKDQPGCRLFRNNIQVMEAPDVFLDTEIWQSVRIEKTDSHLHVYIDNHPKCHYISHTPLAGTHIGLLLRDADLELSPLHVFIGSQNVMVSCLAIPDAFLANKDFAKAISEYRRISTSFPGRTEGREALFRSGVTLLEAGLVETKSRLKDQFFSSALEEFGKLSGTAGAPLEYLGKSLVYKALGETEEEAKCLELALRKYKNHPLYLRLVEHIVFRLHESSSHDRQAAYHFALLTLRLLPNIFKNPANQKLITSMKQHFEILPFIHEDATVVYLAFFLAKPIPLLEMTETGPWAQDASDALLYLGCHPGIKENQDVQYRFQEAIDDGRAEEILPYVKDDVTKLWALLLSKKWEEAKIIFEKYSLEQLSQESSPLFPLFGCFLWKTEGEEIARIHFNAVLETSYPPTSALLAYFLADRLDLKKLFLWEKMQLYRQLILLSICSDRDKEPYVKQLKRLKHVTRL